MLHITGRPPSEYLCPMENGSQAVTPSTTESEKVKSAVAMYKKELSKQEGRRESKLKKKS